MTTKVLLADDHKIMRDGLISLLAEAEDIKVIAEAATGREAVEKTLALDPDVVIMDLNLPELSGIEATRKILEAAPQKRILILSMLQDNSCVQRSLKSGVKGYLLKNCASEELIEAIRALAAGESYLCRQVTEMVMRSFATQDGGQTLSSPYAELSRRELEVLRLIAAGNTTKEIAYTLNLSIKTVDVHRHRIMKKLDLRGVAELTKYAIREGLTTIE